MGSLAVFPKWNQAYNLQKIIKRAEGKLTKEAYVEKVPLSLLLLEKRSFANS